MAIIHGTPWNDWLYGTSYNDVMYGYAGNDYMFGFNGNDYMYGHAGNDRMYGSYGNDWLDGGAGGDYLHGGSGIDTASYIYSTGPVYVDLETGKGYWNDAHGDTLVSIENVYGSRYNDYLYGNDYANRLYGYNGDDLLEGRGGADYLSGGGGTDTASYYSSPGRVYVDLETGKGYWNDAHGDTLYSIEKLFGSQYSDYLYGNDYANSLNGFGGSDWLEGRGGADYLNGGSGADTASYASSPGAVYVSLYTGKGYWNDAQGDTLVSIENLYGSGYNDYLYGDNFANRIYASSGDDYVYAYGGNDYVYGGYGNDRLYGANGNDVMVGASGDDYIDGGSGNDQLYGGADDDTFYFTVGSYLQWSPYWGYYHVPVGSGSDTIDDFEPGRFTWVPYDDDHDDDDDDDDDHDHDDGYAQWVKGDIIKINTYGRYDYIDTYDELRAFTYQNGNDVVINVANVMQITLEDTQLGDLNPNDFEFV